MTEKENKFATHAEDYLTQWKTLDSRARKIFTNSNRETLEKRTKRVESIFRQYGIFDNFVDIGMPKSEREQDSKPALQIVDAVSESDFERDGAVKTVDLVRGRFKSAYSQDLLVAASKTLWFKFRAPIIVCDRLTITALCLERSGLEYQIFCDKWRKKFDAHKNEIREACTKLSQGCLDDGQEITSQPWFEERVFDLYLMFLGRCKESSS